MKEQDVANASKQFADASPKAKWCKFGQCKDDLPDLVPLHQVLPIMPSASVKLSETGILQFYYSPREESEGQSIYHCLLKRP